MLKHSKAAAKFEGSKQIIFMNYLLYSILLSFLINFCVAGILNFPLIFFFWFCISITKFYHLNFIFQKGLKTIRCPTPTLKNGKIKWSKRGGAARFTCNSKYELVGPPNISCNMGRFNGHIPVCMSLYYPTSIKFNQIILKF